jgi:hypothetical protein
MTIKCSSVAKLCIAFLANIQLVSLNLSVEALSIIGLVKVLHKVSVSLKAWCGMCHRRPVRAILECSFMISVYAISHG